MSPYDFAVATVLEAGTRLLAARDAGFTSASKGADVRDIVTSVDGEVNAFLMDTIGRAFPEHAIYSEEGGSEGESAEFLWTIDPIDGSANFSRGIPHFAVCLGLLEHGTPSVGAIHNPVTRECFSFERGKGAFLNGKPIEVSKIAELRDAHVFFHAGRKDHLREWGGRSYEKLLGSARKTSNLASSSLDTCFVAAGRIEANVYGTLSTLDIAPALGLLVEAGGVFSDADGNAPSLSAEPRMIFMANSPSLLEQVRTLLAS